MSLPYKAFGRWISWPRALGFLESKTPCGARFYKHSRAPFFAPCSHMYWFRYSRSSRGLPSSSYPFGPPLATVSISHFPPDTGYVCTSPSTVQARHTSSWVSSSSPDSRWQIRTATTGSVLRYFRRNFFPSSNTITVDTHPILIHSSASVDKPLLPCFSFTIASQM